MKVTNSLTVAVDRLRAIAFDYHDDITLMRDKRSCDIVRRNRKLTVERIFLSPEDASLRELSKRDTRRDKFVLQSGRSELICAQISKRSEDYDTEKKNE